MLRPAVPSRRFVDLRQSLYRDVSSYALAASATGVAALALAPPASAQIVYTPAHGVIHSGEKMFIDFNHDGLNDVMVREIAFPSSYSNAVQAVPAPPGGGIQLGLAYGGAAALPAGALIGSRRHFFSRSIDMAHVDDTYTSLCFGSWVGSPHAFLGVRFTIGREIHYGWAQIDLKRELAPQYFAVLLTGYAYETQPDVPIRAGDRG
ncbi:MAG TPA: hypothetical protein VND65_00670 [Candidatus Binatia bacterium]|nr:hypothetical protein [Candidatus Binatia bacterium]